MLEILKYSFFQNALIGGIIISLISGILGVFIIMRKESNITHAISNFLFLGIAISLFFSKNYYIYGFIFGIIGALFIFFIEKTQLITKESTKEIISQAGMAGGIFTIGFIENLSLDINNFLFGSILFISREDLIILSVLLFIVYILFIIFGKPFLAIIINQDIAISKGLKINIYNIFFLIILSIFIAISIKIFGILLIGAFLVIPSNIGKVLGNSIKSVFLFSVFFAVFSTILGLFGSYFLGTSAGSTIVLILIFIFISAIIYKKI